VNDQTQKLLNKADRAIHAAERLLGEGDLDFAASRAYYAMFYATEALLNEKGLRFRKHGGVHAAFGEHFIKSGLFDQKYHQWLLDAFDKRLQSDYGVEIVITSEEVSRTIEQARSFVQQSRNYLIKS
jgi:uncharacterized protein (UPF0332 family)